jgi:hypothetical protein
MFCFNSFGFFFGFARAPAFSSLDLRGGGGVIGTPSGHGIL